MICPNCGQPIDQGALFCGNCGQNLVAAPVATPQPPIQTMSPIPPGVTPLPMPIQTPVPINPTMAPQQTFAAPPTVVGPTYNGAAPQAVGYLPPAPAAPGVMMSGMPQPAYASPQQNMQTHTGETKAIIGLVLAVLAVPGALIPIVGLILGITGLVIGTLSRHIKRGISLASIIVGTIAIVLSLAAWAYTATHDPRLKKTNLSSATQNLDTPCYSAKISTSLHIDNSGGTCKILAMNGATAETSSSVMSINSVYDSTLNASNFNSWTQSASPSIVQAASTADRTYTLSSEKDTTFGGKQAHVIIADSNQHTQVELISVLYDAPNGDNVFIITNAVSSGNASLSELEKSFVWK